LINLVQQDVIVEFHDDGNVLHQNHQLVEQMVHLILILLQMIFLSQMPLLLFEEGRGLSLGSEGSVETRLPDNHKKFISWWEMMCWRKVLCTCVGNDVVGENESKVPKVHERWVMKTQESETRAIGTRGAMTGIETRRVLKRESEEESEVKASVISVL
jgi:hypothetical protein